MTPQSDDMPDALRVGGHIPSDPKPPSHLLHLDWFLPTGTGPSEPRWRLECVSHDPADCAGRIVWEDLGPDMLAGWFNPNPILPIPVAFADPVSGQSETWGDDGPALVYDIMAPRTGKSVVRH